MFTRYWNTSEEDRERQRALNAPLPTNDPRLIAPTRVKVLRPFHVAGVPLAIGATTTLTRADADSMIALGKAQLVN
jgi:hypothetical protein